MWIVRRVSVATRAGKGLVHPSRNLRTVSGSSSVTARTGTPLLSLQARSSGTEFLQGPHQVAQKKTSRLPPAAVATSSAGVRIDVRVVSGGAASPAFGGAGSAGALTG